MKAVRGALLTCDAAVKQLLLNLNDAENFIIEDLDDTHLVVKPEEIEHIKRLLETELEKNTYSLDATE